MNAKMIELVIEKKEIDIPLEDLMTIDDAARELEESLPNVAFWMYSHVLPTYLKPHQVDNPRPRRYTSRKAVMAHKSFLAVKRGGKEGGQLVLSRPYPILEISSN